MSTELKSLYRSLSLFSLGCQEKMCADLIRSGRLARCFDHALRANTKSFDNQHQPFLDQATILDRTPIDLHDENENRVIAVIQKLDPIRVVTGPGNYEFRYVERQFPPFRRAGAGDPHSGAGGIDYIARTATSPILGEVKWRGDQNAFYAFVQLIAYLSEMATESQIARARASGEFKVSIADRPSFDLHILLADRDPRSAKVRLIEPTRVLASLLRRDLANDFPKSSEVLGSILCLEMNTEMMRQDPENGIHCHWVV